MNNNIVVSVWTIVYNHEKYIAQAIESVLSQKCNFKIEMIIGEDCSTDNSRQIIKQYQEKYPDIIKPIYNTKNLGPQGNAVSCMNAAKGKYLATLEGDDYWVDGYKLQKQVDFMEAHPDFSACFTKAEILNELNVAEPNVFAPISKDVFTFEDFIIPGTYFIPSATMLFKNDLKLPDFFLKTLSGDFALHLLLSEKGKIKFLHDITAMYRVHGGGLSKSPEFIKRVEDDSHVLYKNIDKYFNYKYHNALKKHLLPVVKSRLIYGSKDLNGITKLKHVFNVSKLYFFYSDKINPKEIIYYTAILFFPWVLKLKKVSR